ncbi:PAS domain S-box protein [Pseudorhodoferax sp. Leaf267]|uniref:PAS domain-containing protein n=1 Tax=Pseudorhodoferax sp. Leaf267 TaxID=1736316 RepID=UPI0006FB6193|nr:PAS domain S-box protein [Pseudorhodoferax sp. Leaf267]KQP19562.1 hypothetical protein ASF43_28660 [Pseudorhodoferax sp. Leaf267]
MPFETLSAFLMPACEAPAGPEAPAAPASPAALDGLLETALASGPDGCVVLDLAGRIVRCNERFADLWQLPSTLLSVGTADAVRAYMARQLVDATRFLDRVGQDIAHATLPPTESFALHDGRVFVRRVTPWYAGRTCMGLLVRWRDGTESTALREALAASEASHQALLDHLDNGVFVARGGRFLATNAALPALLGYNAQAFLGLGFEDVIAPEFLALWKHRLANHLPQGEATRRSYRLRLLPRCGDEAVWIELQVRPSLHQGQPCVLGLVRDVTERRRAEQCARLRERVQASLPTAADLDSVLGAIVCGTEDMLPTLRSALLVREPGADRLRLAAAASLPEALAAALDGLPLSDAARHGLATQRSGTLMVDGLAQAEADPAFAAAVAASGLRASWSTPVLGAGGMLLGVLVAYREAPGAPSAGDATALAHAAQLAATAIERRHADAQSRLAALAQQCSGEGQMVLDAQQRVLWVNPAFLRITGHAADELLGVDVRRFDLAPNGRHFLHDLCRALQADGQWRGLVHSRRRDGQTLTGWVTVQRCGTQGQTVVLLSDAGAP